MRKCTVCGKDHFMVDPEYKVEIGLGGYAICEDCIKWCVAQLEYFSELRGWDQSEKYHYTTEDAWRDELIDAAHSNSWS